MGDAQDCELDYRRRAAAGGDVDAMLRLADIYVSKGETVLAHQWTSAASRAGSVQANFSLAYFQQHGIGTRLSTHSACVTYCSLVHLEAEPILARGAYREQVLFTIKQCTCMNIFCP